jgi:spoIIIJ-associated protein
VEIERSAASVEEAVEAALAELGVSEQEAEIHIVQEPRSGFLGINSSPAVVRVRALTPQRTEAASGGEAIEEVDDEQAEAAADFLDGLFEVMHLDADVEPAQVDGILYVDVWGPESSEGMGVLIGHHGHTLDGLQELVRAVVQRQFEGRCHVVVDVEDYRKRRRSQLVRRAREVARRVLKTGEAEALEPMTAFERKIVHDSVSDIAGVETGSEGEDPNRRVFIKPGP